MPGRSFFVDGLLFRTRQGKPFSSWHYLLRLLENRVILSLRTSAPKRRESLFREGVAVKKFEIELFPARSVRRSARSTRWNARSARVLGCGVKTVICQTRPVQFFHSSPPKGIWLPFSLSPHTAHVALGYSDEIRSSSTHKCDSKRCLSRHAAVSGAACGVPGRPSAAIDLDGRQYRAALCCGFGPEPVSGAGCVSGKPWFSL